MASFIDTQVNLQTNCFSSTQCYRKNAVFYKVVVNLKTAKYLPNVLKGTKNE